MEAEDDSCSREMFIELMRLEETDYEGLEWKETARWIKYEESGIGGGNRWGKPHIPCLNLNAIHHLQEEIEHGSFLLDVKEQNLSNIWKKIVNAMAMSNQISATDKDPVHKLLLLRNHHIRETLSAFRRASRAVPRVTDGDDGTITSAGSGEYTGRSSTRKSISSLFRLRSPSIAPEDGDRKSGRRDTITQIELGSSFRSRKDSIQNMNILQKLPERAEACAVLVGSLDFLTKPALAFVRLAEPAVMDGFVEVPLPVRFIFVLLWPEDDDRDFHEIGRAFATLMSDQFFRQLAYKARNKGQVLVGIGEFLKTSLLIPLSEWNNNDLIPVDDIRLKSFDLRRTRENAILKLTEQAAEKSPLKELLIEKQPPPKRDPLQRKGIPFYGLIQDIKIRYSQYWSDIRDGLNMQVLSAAIFIFFAALSPAVTFGGIYADKTDRLMGVGETLLASCINGVIFAVFAAQPILIIGATGPLMIFDMSLLQFCNQMDLDYLSIRTWVGMWLLFIGLLVAAFEAVAIVKTFTRFTEEIFSSLVCIIFIYGAFENLAKVFIKNPLIPKLEETDDPDTITYTEPTSNATNITIVDDPEPEPNASLLSLILMLSTFIIAWKLKKFRNSKFLSRGIRRALGDFGVPIAIFVMVLIDFLIRDNYTDKLNMPAGLQPSDANIRGWIINPMGVVKPLPIWCMIAAGPASLLLFTLIFLEGNICHLILGKPERGLKKGSGFHLDIVLSCAINTISGFVGAPFMGPACVRTISHMSALTIMSSNVAPGESPKIVGCFEQRLSAFVVSLCIGFAVFLSSILNYVPRSVLLGVFLYMGVSATAGIQFLERLVLFFMPVENHPSVPYVKNIRTRKMYIFTAIQLFLLAILWAVTLSPASLAVPFILMCLIPIRIYLLPYIFSPSELRTLDGVEQSAVTEEGDQEPDFYETSHDLPVQAENHRHHA